VQVLTFLSSGNGQTTLRRGHFELMPDAAKNTLEVKITHYSQDPPGVRKLLTFRTFGSSRGQIYNNELLNHVDHLKLRIANRLYRSCREL
jgi:hypothetical protein